MKKIEKKVNVLIKQKNLIKELHKRGIIRVNKKALNHLSEVFKKEIFDTIEILARELLISGKKTLETEDINRALKKLKEKEEGWEI